mmetsp:Transcript_13555/g.13756  ORF Transcript_13555/g.13756 Transcript_13555/m.13756 type:complete len:121 (-) Transcript_13555:107-469(-)
MLTLMAAQFTRNVFNEGLDNIHIKLRSVPFLEEEVPAIAERYKSVTGQVMSKTNIKCLRPVEQAGVMYDLLRSCRHQGISDCGYGHWGDVIRSSKSEHALHIAAAADVWESGGAERECLR